MGFVQVENKPFPSSLVPLFQNEAFCKTFHMKMSLICMKMNRWRRLVLTQRTRKWLVKLYDTIRISHSFLFPEKSYNIPPMFNTRF